MVIHRYFPGYRSLSRLAAGHSLTERFKVYSGTGGLSGTLENLSSVLNLSVAQFVRFLSGCGRQLKS